MNKIRIAQIGTGANNHGNEIFSTLKKNPDCFDLVGYALPEGERARMPNRLSVFQGYREMSLEEVLNDPAIEAVTVETDEIYSTKYAIMAVRAGKHVHLEKPGSPSLDEFEELIFAAKEHNRILHLGYMYRYNPIIRDMMARVRAGELGDIISVDAHMSCYHGRELTNWLSCFEGGMMFYLGGHILDLVLQLQGNPIRIIPFNKNSGRFEGGTSKDVSMAVLEYEHGASVIKTSGAEYGGFLNRHLMVTGTKGTFQICPLEISDGYPQQYTEYRVNCDPRWGSQGEWLRSEKHDRYEEMMRSFARMAAGEIDNPYSLDYELNLFRTLKYCCQ